MSESDQHTSSVDAQAGRGPEGPAPELDAPAGTGHALDDTIFRTTQRIPRIVDAPIVTPPDAPPPVREPVRRGLIPVLLVAVASLGALIAWPLLTATPPAQRPAVVPPVTTSMPTAVAPLSTDAAPSEVTPTHATPEPEPVPLPIPVRPATRPAPTVTVTVVATSTISVSPSSTATPSASPTPSPTPTPHPSESPTQSPSASGTFSADDIGLLAS